MSTNIPKSLIRSLYDIQKIRIETGNRIVAEIKARMGQLPGEKETTIDDAEARNYLKEARAEYSRITDAFVLNRAGDYFKVKYDGYQIIADPVMLLFVRLYMKHVEDEANIEKIVAKIVARHPMWDAFLRDVKGCGPLMSAVILSEFDIHKAERISQFWAYAGLDVAADGRGRGRYKEHLIDVDYTDKDGKAAIRKGITFNPFLKTKLVGVLASSFVKQTKPEPSHYRTVYDNYKHRLENHAKHKDKSKGHRNNMALRYVVKIFLQDLWLKWRQVEGLPITAPYHEAVLGHKHHEKEVA